MSVEYEHFIVTFGYDYIYDNINIMNEYKNITGNNYTCLDEVMMNIIRNGNYNQYKIYHVKKSLVKYITLKSKPGYEYLTFDDKQYKLDTIKKILSSESNCEDAVNLIEKAVFESIELPIISDSQYLSLIS